MTRSTKISILLALSAIALIACFFATVFLSGKPLLAFDIWKLDKSMAKSEAAAWRRKPQAYTAPSLELSPAMNPVAITIAHWSAPAGFPRSSKFTMEVKNAGGLEVYRQEFSLMQKKNEGGSDIVIFEWAADTASINLLPEYLEIPEAGTYTFRLLPGERQEGNHSRLELRLRQQAMRPQWWMLIVGSPLLFATVAIFMLSGMMRMRRILKEEKA